MGGIELLAESIGEELRRRLPEQRKTQRENLALLVATMLDVRSANLIELAAALPRAAERIDMRYQWIARVLANPLIDCDAVMGCTLSLATVPSNAIGIHSPRKPRAGVGPDTVRRRVMPYRPLTLIACLFATSVLAAELHPKEGDFTLPDFHFHGGETLPELHIHYRTLGDPTSPAVLVLHGTSQSGATLLAPDFGGTLFGPGQPLDAARNFIILPDGIGAGRSSKPSDGLHAHFPAYDYNDAVQAQYRLVTEGLHLHHLRLVLGNSMGGMQTWLWAEQHSNFADAWVPMASQPTPMSSRNWMLRRALVEEIRHDPAAMRYAVMMFNIATSGGTLAWQAQAPTAAKADALVDEMAAHPLPDPDDFAYQWDSSHDYDAMPGLDRITGPVLVINAADDERNPPESGLMDRALARLPHAQYDLIPASAETRGHGTTGIAKFWAERLRHFLAGVPAAAPG